MSFKLSRVSRPRSRALPRVSLQSRGSEDQVMEFFEWIAIKINLRTVKLISPECKVCCGASKWDVIQVFKGSV